MSEQTDNIRKLGDLATRLLGGETFEGDLAEKFAQLSYLYGQYCEEANDRLETCLLYSRQGFTAESVRRANESPALLGPGGLVTSLLGPSATGIRSVIAKSGVAYRKHVVNKPQVIDAQAAELLNGVLGAEREHRELSDKYRAKCFAGANASKRLAIMRKLYALPTKLGNAAYRAELKLLEKERVAQIVATLVGGTAKSKVSIDQSIILWKKISHLLRIGKTNPMEVAIVLEKLGAIDSALPEVGDACRMIRSNDPPPKWIPILEKKLVRRIRGFQHDIESLQLELRGEWKFVSQEERNVIKNMPPQKNSWVNFGSGRSPRL